MFTGMLAAKTPDGLLRNVVRAVSAVRRLLPRYNDREDACSVTLLARYRCRASNLTDDASREALCMGGVQYRYRLHAVRKRFCVS